MQAYPQTTGFTVRELAIDLAIFYSVITSHFRPVVWTQIRKALSASLTLCLLAVSTFGFYQAGVILSHARQQSANLATVQTPSKPAARPVGYAASTPLQLDMPAIGLSSSLVPVGQNEDGSMEVPGPGEAGWYTLGPTPGEIGPAIIVGHVDYITGPAIFQNLHTTKPGDRLSIAREDGTTINFIVEKVASYDQHNFPADEVYGNLAYPGLRLITCDGEFNPFTRHYSHNLVVFAKLADSKP